jgi:hypothetical protein
MGRGEGTGTGNVGASSTQAPGTAIKQRQACRLELERDLVHSSLPQAPRFHHRRVDLDQPPTSLSSGISPFLNTVTFSTTNPHLTELVGGLVGTSSTRFSLRERLFWEQLRRLGAGEVVEGGCCQFWVDRRRDNAWANAHRTKKKERFGHT